MKTDQQTQLIIKTCNKFYQTNIDPEHYKTTPFTEEENLSLYKWLLDGFEESEARCKEFMERKYPELI